MAQVTQNSIFHWGDFAVRTDMERFSIVINNLPDEKIVRYLEVMRQNGREDYPVRPIGMRPSQLLCSSIPLLPA